MGRSQEQGAAAMAARFLYKAQLDRAADPEYLVSQVSNGSKTPNRLRLTLYDFQNLPGTAQLTGSGGHVPERLSGPCRLQTGGLGSVF